MIKIPKYIEYLPVNYKDLSLQTQYDLAKKQTTNILYVGKRIIKYGTFEQKQDLKNRLLKYNEIYKETLENLIKFKYPEYNLVKNILI